MKKDYTAYGISKLSIFCCMLTVIVATLSSNLLTLNYHEKVSKVISYGMDGLIVWAPSRFLNLGVLPIALVIYIMAYYENHTRNISVVRHADRKQMWVSERIIALLICMISYVFVMLVSFIMAMIINKGQFAPDSSDTFYLTNTYLGAAMLKYNGGIPRNVNLFQAVLSVYVINVLELYLMLSISNLIYWVSGNKLVAISVIIVAGFLIGIYPKTNRYFGWLGVKTAKADYYHEAMYIGKTLTVVLVLAAVNILIGIMARIAIRRKDFIR